MRLSQSKCTARGCKFKRIARDTTIKRTAKVYLNQNYYRGCQNQNYCQEGLQSKRLLGSATNKITSRKSQANELIDVQQTKILSGSIAIKITAREYHHKRYCQGVPQTKVLPMSVTIKRAAKANHYQNYHQA